MDMHRQIEIVRGPDGDTVLVGGVSVPGATVISRDLWNVVISLPASAVGISFKTARIALEE